MSIIDYIIYRAYMGMSHRKGELREIGAHRYTLAVCVCLFSPLVFIILTPFNLKNQDVNIIISLFIYIIFFYLFEKKYDDKKIEKIIITFKKKGRNNYILGNTTFLVVVFLISVLFFILSVHFIHVVAEKYQLNGIFYRIFDSYV